MATALRALRALTAFSALTALTALRALMLVELILMVAAMVMVVGTVALSGTMGGSVPSFPLTVAAQTPHIQVSMGGGSTADMMPTTLVVAMMASHSSFVQGSPTATSHFLSSVP